MTDNDKKETTLDPIEKLEIDLVALRFALVRLARKTGQFKAVMNDIESFRDFLELQKESEDKDKKEIKHGLEDSLQEIVDVFLIFE